MKSYILAIIIGFLLGEFLYQAPVAFAKVEICSVGHNCNGGEGGTGGIGGNGGICFSSHCNANGGNANGGNGGSVYVCNENSKCS
jgi:hypothetical protein